MTDPRPSEVQALAEIMEAEAGRQFPAYSLRVWSEFATRLHARGVRVAPSPTEDVYVGPIRHDNAMCKKDGCTCWCQACERHNWRHERGVAPSPDAPGREREAYDAGRLAGFEEGLAASGDAPREGLRERAYCIHGVSETQECDDCGGLSFIASESHPTKEQTDG